MALQIVIEPKCHRATPRNVVARIPHQQFILAPSSQSALFAGSGICPFAAYSQGSDREGRQTTIPAIEHLQRIELPSARLLNSVTFSIIQFLAALISLWDGS
jgi:hypothetical protein